MIRRLLPFVLVPLGVLACGLAGSPWLRAFPAGVLAAPLFGAAVLGVLVPVVVVGIGVRRLWASLLVDALVYVFFMLLVTLHEPLGVADLYSGLAHGPSQILTFALPLVSPRTLLVAPVTLCWISGAVVGECIGRAWHSVLPYATLIATFALAYAGSVRGVTIASDGRRYDTLLAAALLLVLLLMRAIQAWIEQDLDSDAGQPDGALPLRGLVVGSLVALLVTALAGAAVQEAAFSGPPAAPDRTPPLDSGQPLSPVAFVAGLRPVDARGSRTLFTLRVDRRTSGYVGLADVDSYDGAGWSFDRTFRPSGGAIPAETDPGLRAPGAAVTQQYTISSGALTTAPWMPFLYRPQSVTGTSVDVDSSSGMIVPSRRVRTGERYSVTSTPSRTDFGELGSSAFPATSTPTSYTFVPGSVAASLPAVVSSFAAETGTSSSNPLALLRALEADLRANYALAGPAPAAQSGSAQPGSAQPGSAQSGSAQSGSAPPTADAARATPSAGGTGFANVLAAILGPDRTATPEQYATLVALVARQLGVPARLVAGFRIGAAGAEIAPGRTYRVTTAEASTWVEIPIQGRGWVVLDPSPLRYSNKQRRSRAAAKPSSSPTPTVTPNGLATQSAGGHAVAPRSAVPDTAAPSRTPVLVLALIGVALAAGVIVLALVLRKRLRARRRRRTGDPRRRLLGAWQESLDVLVEAGLGDPAHLTSAEVAAATQQRFGAPSAAQARYLGDSANTAIFSPSSWVGQAEADAAWQVHGVLRRSVRDGLSLRERLAAGLRYRRPPRRLAPPGPSSWAAPARTGGRHSSRARG